MKTWNINFLSLFSDILGNERGSFNPGGEGAAGNGGTNGSGAGDAGATGGDSTQGAGPNEGGGTNTSSEPSTSIHYPQGLDPELQQSKIFEPFVNSDNNIDYANLMKSYAHQQKLIGKDKIIVPGKDTTEEQWGEIYSKLGLPDRKEYGVENKLPEGMQPNEKLFNGLLDVAHQNGVLPKQMQPIVDFFNEQIGTHAKEADAQLTAMRHNEVEALKKEWGQGYDKNINLADQALKQFADDATIQQLGEAGLLESPALTKLFANIGKGLSEESVFTDEQKQTFGMTPEEASMKIKEFYDPKSAMGAAFMSSSHPDHKYAVQKMMELQTLVHGSKNAGGTSSVGTR